MAEDSERLDAVSDDKISLNFECGDKSVDFGDHYEEALGLADLNPVSRQTDHAGCGDSDQIPVDSLPDNYAAGATALAANALCKDCGICCTGILFTSVPLDEKELKGIKHAGISVHKRSDDQYVFNLPCSRFSGGSCSMYCSRPATCSSYYCKLQKKVMNGSLSLQQGQKIVSSVKAQADWLLQKARENSKQEVKNINLRSFFGWYHKRAAKLAEQDDLSTLDKENIGRAFELLKLVDRYFESTRLLAKFAALIQSCPLEGSDSQG